MSKSHLETFKKFCNPVPEGCWLWSGSRSHHGYGAILRRVNGKSRKIRAHRFSFEHYIGPIPEGMSVCHKCDTPSCVRPDHLFLGTNTDNRKDSRQKGRARGGTPKLKPDDIIEIKQWLAGHKPQTEIAALKKVSQEAISKIARGITWAWVK